MQFSGQILQPKVEQSVVVGGLRVVLLDYGKDVEGKPAGERKGKLIKRRQVGQEMRRTALATSSDTGFSCVMAPRRKLISHPRRVHASRASSASSAMHKTVDVTPCSVSP